MKYMFLEELSADYISDYCVVVVVCVVVIVICVVLLLFCCSMYCLCVNVYCNTATG